MIKKQYLAVASALILTAGLFPASSDAQVAKKNLTANYNNIKVLYNGSQVSTTIEPFIVNGTTYIPLRMMAGVFNKDITWDGTNYTINVKDTVDTGYQAELAQKDAEIARLKAQIEDLNDEIDGLEDDLSDYEDDDDSDIDDDLSDLEDELNDEFEDYDDDLGSISIEIDGDEDEVEVEIYVDGENYEDSTGDEIDTDALEDLVQDVVEYIWDEYDDNVDVTGTIYDESDDDEELYDFEGDSDDEAIYLDGDEI
ncbi:stalk domain-containing protein [Brevibacillus nitrificans]|uniref:stalk domain-containing protein n=1 Tax=Brevibacillus nitrificans TaxID=651560 RepID=UPI0026321F94|nr:stalk domain-containing protein [Brevibacillus nitrificans]MED1793399.1 stalk domain-containing protein [Brevibacillus nitrificans]